MKFFYKPRTLFFHISIRFIFLILITTLAIGIPAIFFFRYQLDRQIWNRIEQGARTAQALASIKELELSGSAKLVAERPTLLTLMNLGDQRAVSAYLSILQAGIGRDLIIICNQDGNILAATQHFPVDSICRSPKDFVVLNNYEPEAWLLKNHAIKDGSQMIGTVIIGDQYDQQFASLISNDTGLDYLIVYEGKIIASSLKQDSNQLDDPTTVTLRHTSDSSNQRLRFTLENIPYYAVRFPTNHDELVNILAQPAGDLVDAAHRQVFLMLLGILAVVCLSVLTSNLIAHRVSQPLEELASQALRESGGGITTPLVINSPITEVNSLAKAYEISRQDLSRSLNSLQQEQVWNKHLLEAIAEGIMTLDSNQLIMFFSPAAERITGWKREDVINRPVDEFFKLTEKDELFSSNLPSPGEKYFLNVEMAQKRQTTLSISGAEFIPSETSDTQIALVFRDVTEEVAINRLLGQFLSNVAHEFRTPLSALSASVELLEDQFPDFARDEVMELIRSQKLGVLGLETLIDNLLESSSIEARRFRVTPKTFDIESIISDVAQTMAPLLEKHGQRLVINIPTELPLVYGDPRRTVQVLINLVSNAIKYGPVNSNITILAQERDRKVRISVSDNGPGISPEYRQEIFSRFNIPRTDSERAKPGAGLGLSVVKAIVEAQGGEVGVEDNPGSGARFWFTMRLAKNR